MATYLVMVNHPSVREKLVLVCNKVGRPGALQDVLIVETDRTKEELEGIQGVVSVEADGEAEPDDLPAINTREGPSNWFLKALSQHRLHYRYYRQGLGVDLYIIDSGIWIHHPEFEDRISTLYSFDGAPYGDDVKTPQHGTMCAGCAAGTTYGVAGKAVIFNLRVNWRNSTILKAMDAMLKHHLNKPDDRPSILSMSFSTLDSWVYRSAIARLIDHGVVCFASTGNDGYDQASFPAGNDLVMGVGCLQYRHPDPTVLFPARYSNYGKGADVWAPGHDGRVAGYRTHGTMRASGTSAACPVAAGIMAQWLEGRRKLTTRKEVAAVLEEFMIHCTVNIPLTGKYRNTSDRMVTSVFHEADEAGLTGNDALTPQLTGWYPKTRLGQLIVRTWQKWFG